MQGPLKDHKPDKLTKLIKKDYSYQVNSLSKGQVNNINLEEGYGIKTFNDG